jgi:hypothetical protein
MEQVNSSPNASPPNVPPVAPVKQMGKPPFHILPMISRLIVILIIGVLFVGGAYYLGARSNLLQLSKSQPIATHPAGATIAPTAPISPDPDTVTQNYYNWYLDCTNQHLTGTSTGSKQVDCAFNKTGALTDSLVTTLQQAIMYDPILCAQNIPDKLTFDKSVITNGTATVMVHTIWGAGSPGNIQVGLQQLSNVWKINSIGCNISQSQSTVPFYSKDLDATFYLPSGWTVSVLDRDPMAAQNTVTACTAANEEFYKDPAQCKDNADTFLIGINTSSKQTHWPNFDMNIDGPTEGLGGACPPEDVNQFTQSLTINGKPYTATIYQDKTSGAYQDCFQFPTITESGTKSKWKQFNVMFVAPTKAIFDQMMSILQTAKFN